MMTTSTRERLMSEALRLFAQQGFHRTTVGEVEAAAGLTPRGGALYKHFDSKERLLEEAMEHAVDATVRVRNELLGLLPLDDWRSELTLFARWVLIELERDRYIVAILEKDGDSFPHLVKRFYVDHVARGHQSAMDYVTVRLGEEGHPMWDAEALTAIIVGALVNFRRNQWTFGATVLGVEEERLVATLVQLLGAVGTET